MLLNRFRNGIGLDTLSDNMFESVEKTLADLERAKQEKNKETKKQDKKEKRKYYKNKKSKESMCLSRNRLS